MLADSLLEVFESSGNFKGWSLSQIILDAEQFFVFIQERWPIFLENLNQTNQVKEDSGAYGLKVQGPPTLPFDHQDIRVYIDNLFVEGKLTPVDLPSMDVGKDSWVLSGIAAAESDSEHLRISRLFELVDAADLSMDSRYTDWIAFAIKWAELSALIHTASHAAYQKRYYKTAQKNNALFADWLETHYASLINLPPSNPAMLHHLPRHLPDTLKTKKTIRSHWW